MKQQHVTFVIDQEIDLIETLMAQNDKHMISTETLKNRTLLHIVLMSGNDDTEWLADVGLGQAIQSRLWAHGYRSVRRGYFVNLDTCEDVNYLVALYDNADINVSERVMVRERIKKIRNQRCDGQLSFDANGKIIIPITEEEFMSRIIADAV